MKRRHRSLVLVAIVLLAATTPVVGESPGAEFGTQVVETTAGETAEIPVTLSDTGTATVTIGSEQVNYIATVVIEDGNADQNVVLRYNTSNAGHGGAFSVADEADTVTVKSETEFDDDRLLAVGTYDLAVATGNTTENETDVASFAVMTPPETTTEAETTTQTSQYAGHVDDIEGGVIVAPAQNQTITGTLDLPQGTEIIVEARKGGDFLMTRGVTVDEDGRFRASFDFDGVSNDMDSEFVIEIRVDGDTVEEVTAVFETPPTTTTTTTQTTTKQTTTTTKQSSQTETTDSTKDETADSTQDGSTPGFSLSTGVFALAATLLLVLRRD